MKIKKNDVRQYFEFLFFFLIMSYSGFFKYIVFALWIGFFMIKGNIKLQKQELYIILPSLICVLIGLLMNLLSMSFNIQVMKEVVFYLLPPIGSVIIWKKYELHGRKIIDVLFFAIITVFLITSINNFSKTNSFESQYAFIIGVFTLYYFFIKEIKLSVISSIALILANKRIAWAGVIVGLIVIIFLHRKTSNNKLNYKKYNIVVTVIGIATIISLLVWIFLVSNGLLSAILRRYNVSSQGRVEQWTTFSNYYNLSIWQLGYGLGYVSGVLAQWNIKTFLNLHNDILLLYVQLGFWGFVIYFYSYFSMIKYYIKKHIKDYKTVIILCTLILYTFVCYSTDNISIYINYLFPFYIVILDIIFNPKYCNNLPSIK